MKTALSILAVCLVIAYVNGAAAPNNVKDKVGALAKKCAADHKANQEQAKIAFTQKLPTDEVERCYLECVYTGVGVIQGGEYSVEGSKKLATQRFSDAKEHETVNKLIDTCSKEVTKVKDEKCSLGRTVRECFVKHGEKVHFFPSAN
uniref:Putative odorant-binding protein n=1 Tax=Triatoma brasiliensis TaxID=65344 RepID=A0A163GQU8_TRIBS|nr:putative odorant-binding protein [Triatoma brasiliensis]